MNYINHFFPVTLTNFLIDWNSKENMNLSNSGCIETYIYSVALGVITLEGLRVHS